MVHPFVKFLNNLETSKNKLLIEAVKAGYRVMVEARAMSLDELDEDNYEDESLDDIDPDDNPDSVQWGVATGNTFTGGTKDKIDASADTEDENENADEHSLTDVAPSTFAVECKRCGGTGKTKIGKLCNCCKGIGYVLSPDEIENDCLCEKCFGLGLYLSPENVVEQCEVCNGTGINPAISGSTKKSDDGDASSAVSTSGISPVNNNSELSGLDDEQLGMLTM